MNDLELIDYRQSAVLERPIVDFGKTLHKSLVDAEREDEIMALSELTGEFTLLASAYSDKTERLREDLGVSLNEAAIMKLNAVKQNPAAPDSEWKHYAADAEKALAEVDQRNYA